MDHKSLSIRPFIGAIDFDTSREFYKDLGFQEVILNPMMSLLKQATRVSIYKMHSTATGLITPWCFLK